MKRSASPLSALVCAFALWAVMSPSIAAASTASDTVRGFYQTLLYNMQNGPSVGQQAFERYVTAVYAERFDKYSGERLEVIGEQPTSYGTMVKTQIVKASGEPVTLNYLMVNASGGPQIGDVYLSGTISELAARRADFSSTLRTQGVPGLIAALNNKALTLAPALSGSSSGR